MSTKKFVTMEAGIIIRTQISRMRRRRLPVENLLKRLKGLGSLNWTVSGSLGRICQDGRRLPGVMKWSKFYWLLSIYSLDKSFKVLKRFKLIIRAPYYIIMSVNTLNCSVVQIVLFYQFTLYSGLHMQICGEYHTWCVTHKLQNKNRKQIQVH